uniref:Uncharacterized protein n=1 Tax=Phlebotomus papatasi TaxID=29031 RepID=A0A1B0D217_PHLPP
MYLAKANGSGDVIDISIRKKHARKPSVRTPEMIQSAQTMICDDPRLSIRKIASILEVSDHTMCQSSVWKTLYLPTGRSARAHKSFGPKLQCW